MAVIANNQAKGDDVAVLSFRNSGAKKAREFQSDLTFFMSGQAELVNYFGWAHSTPQQAVGYFI